MHWIVVILGIALGYWIVFGSYIGYCIGYLIGAH